MKKILKLVLIIGIVFLTAPVCSAKEYKVLVLPDNLQFESTNYYVYPDTSVLFASEVIDYLNHSGKVQTVSMAEVRKNFRSNLRLSLLAKNTLKEFKYNYNISFVDLRSIARAFSVDKVLIVTSTTDVQNYFLRRTVWDFLNVPGCTVIDPVYKLNTFAALVDVEEEKILWQQTYKKNIGSMESRIIGSTFAPATEQLDKLKMYSSYLSPSIARNVENGIIPPPVLSVDSEILSQPISNKAEASEAQIVETVNIEQAPFIPSKPRAKNNGSMVNDL